MTEETKKKISETIKRKWQDKKLEKYIIDKGKDILWLWENDIKKENFDISDYLEI